MLRYLIKGGHLISSDLQGGVVYNIEPSRCRVPEDTAKSPGIHKDGSGLYATLFALKQMEKQLTPKRRYLPIYIEELYTPNRIPIAKITEYLKLAYSSIIKLDVINNAFDN